MMKKLLALLLAAVLVLTLGACGKPAEEEQKPLPSPADANTVAEAFIRAFRTRDFITRFSLYLYDARAAWEADTIAAHGSAEAFFAEAEKQAKEKGIDVTVDSFDSYYSAYYRYIQEDYQEIYGEHTITVTATGSVKMTDDLLPEFRTTLLEGPNGKKFDKAVLDSITEVYTITVNCTVQGEKKDFSEDYLVYVVNHDGRWLVANYSA